MIRSAKKVSSEMIMNMYLNCSDAIVFFDGANEIIGMNPAAEAILDPRVLNPASVGDSNSFCYTCRGYTNDSEQMTCLSCYLTDKSTNYSSFQVYLETKNRGAIPYSASFHRIDDESGTRVLILRDLTNQLLTQESLNRNTMTKSIIKAQEDERKRISRELHDSVAQEILSSLVDLRVLKYYNIQDEALQKIQQTEASLTRLLDQIRNLSVELRPASLDDLGLEAAFRSHFKWIEKNYGILVHFAAEMNGVRFNSEIETVVYRICQESILNAMKYADVDEIMVRLFESEQWLELIVTDQGNGFNVNSRDPKGTGLGLYGMKERAELVNGELLILSAPGQGTTVHLQIPKVPVSASSTDALAKKQG